MQDAVLLKITFNIFENADPEMTRMQRWKVFKFPLQNSGNAVLEKPLEC